MKPVNWNDPDLVGKKITRWHNISFVITAVGETVFLCRNLDSGCENAKDKSDHWWYVNEDPEEEVTSPVLKGPVPEGKQTASGIRNTNNLDDFSKDYPRTSGYAVPVEKKLLAPALLQGPVIKWFNYKCGSCGDLFEAGEPNSCISCPAKDIVNLGEVRKPKLLAPALLQDSESHDISISSCLFYSLQQAKGYLGQKFHSWPALPNKDGFYEVSDEAP